MSNLKRLTLLHSNDLHGDFMADNIDASLMGGISMLSGYVKKVRKEEENTLYCIAGDMLQGSIIDSEFKGLSTIEIMNQLDPDIAALGNHEVDYGLAHLLFLERCARFPIVNANLFIRNPYTRLFGPHKILKVGGMKIMFIGIITEEVMARIKQDNLLGSFVGVEDAAREVGRICNAYKTIDIDFTVLLTHIGFEEDKKLANLLDPDWGVDVIIGGHSHTILSQPELVNGILISQAGVGTDQIGRFDIQIDTDHNCVESYTWQLVQINEENCPHDPVMDETLKRFTEKIGDKYDRILCTFPRALTHPDRYRETELGNLVTDLLKDSFGVDIMIIGSGSIRKSEARPLFTYGELIEVMPYDDKIIRLLVTGAQFKKMYAHMVRDEAFVGEHTEFYQYSKGLEVTYNKRTKQFEKFNFNGQPIEDDKIYSIAMQKFHFTLFENNFGFSADDVLKNGKDTVVATSLMDVLEECFTGLKNAEPRIEGRLIVVE